MIDNSQVKKFVSLESSVKPIQIFNENKKEKNIIEDDTKNNPVTMEDLKAKAQMLYFEEEEKQRLKKQKNEILMESLKFQNFKSFLPLPNVRFGNRGSIIPYEQDHLSKFV